MYVGGPAGLRQVADRHRGAETAVVQAPGASLELIETPALSVAEGHAVGEALRRMPAEHRPDAVFCANDLLAMGVLQAVTIVGDVRVPDDVALIGYDDIDFARSNVVALSSIRQPTSRIGTTAIDLLLAAADETHRHVLGHRVFQPELVVRASTG